MTKLTMPRRPVSKSLTRRRVLQGTVSAGLGLVGAPGVMRFAAAQSWRTGNPFSLGIASGAPSPDGFVLWTRLAPDPLSTDPDNPGGMSGGDVTLRYEIATDDGMKDVVRHGTATAEQAFAGGRGQIGRLCKRCDELYILSACLVEPRWVAFIREYGRRRTETHG